MKKRIYSIVGILFMAMSLVLVGCSADGDKAMSVNDSEALTTLGTLILKVNPEIAIDYTDQGEVTNIRALNEDGEEIINDYSDYIGKNSEVVLEELIKLIGDAGYFVEEIEGKSKRIVIELEAGSKVPGDNFLGDMATNAQEAVKEFTSNSEVNIEDVENVSSTEEVETQEKVDASNPEAKKEKEDKNTQKPAAEKTTKSNYLSLDQVKDIALKHAKVSKANARFDSQDLETDDGVPYYELEFEVGENEYDYEIDAMSGKILKFEHDLEEVKKAPVAKKETPKAKELSKDQAINIALKHAGVSRSTVSFDDVELDTDDGRKIWEISFDAGNWEFEYDIDAKTGQILDSEKEHDD